MIFLVRIEECLGGKLSRSRAESHPPKADGVEVLERFRTPSDPKTCDQLALTPVGLRRDLRGVCALGRFETEAIVRCYTEESGARRYPPRTGPLTRWSNVIALPRAAEGG